MLNAAQFIGDRLVTSGLDQVFMVTGGGAMFLNDALAHCPGLRASYTHHEQAAAMAAEAFARLSGRPAVLNVTTGPGGINALNGVFGAWTDSLPMIILSGQVKRPTSLAFHELPGLRQLGDQEAGIVEMVRSITKYAEVVREPHDIAYHLEKALYLAQTGRPGPCWLDIPIDIQSAPVDPGTLRYFTPPAANDRPAVSLADCKDLLGRIAKARRPVILAGTGIRCAGALAEFEQFTRALNVPVTTAWTHDLIASDDPLFCGRPGTIGTRAGNFTVQNADLLLVLGSRLNIRQVSYNWQAFAPRAYKVQVDIDRAELGKPLVHADQVMHCHLQDFLHAMNGLLAAEPPARNPAHHDWLGWCRQRVADYPAVLPRHRDYRGKINPYHFVEVLFAQLEDDDIVACGNATATIVPFQAATLQRGQRLFSNSGSASMGYDLPAAVGAYYGAVSARGRQRRVICLAGDGSLMMNIQELQTIAHHQLPIKIFVLNNGGYLSIRTSQKGFFGRLAGESPASGVSFPDFVQVARAFGIPALSLNSAHFADDIRQFIDSDGPGLCEIVLDEQQAFEPRISSRQLDDGRIVSAPLEDMYPFLERDELARNMID
ncbi:thiamine pyrophosphate-binding protein [Accumulibacter sp.]|uniref:thiamine pyrophosphate-binding protein n=1 Tax=Accumulibacter sp. TaxID=2053492 RepID=UPI0028C48D2F|nr:thiamine pyrophosphate-binding protein [Accumulibacter sp.]